MKTLTLTFLIAAILIAGCSKDQVEPEPPEQDEIITPYVKALINKVPFCVFRDSIKERYSSMHASFSFGTSLLSITETGEVLDSSFTIRASYEAMHISLCFPYRKALQQEKILLYRNIPEITYHWALAGLESVDIVDGKQQGLHYTTYCFNSKNILSEPVGEIKITSYDHQNKSMRGTFSYTAYGYKHENNQITETNNKLEVEKGEFYVEWDEELFQ